MFATKGTVGQEEVGLPPELVDEMKDRIEDQWVYHRITRALFPHHRKKKPVNYSHWGGGNEFFFRHLGEARIQFKLTNLSDQRINPFIDDMGRWLNENFVIRLYGVLDDERYAIQDRKGEVLLKDEKKNIPHSISSFEKEKRGQNLNGRSLQDPYARFYSSITTIADLRNRVGAHQSTDNEADHKVVRSIRKVMEKHHGLEVKSEEEVRYFNLNITKVLEPLKDMAMERIEEYRFQ